MKLPTYIEEMIDELLIIDKKQILKAQEVARRIDLRKRIVESIIDYSKNRYLTTITNGNKETD